MRKIFALTLMFFKKYVLFVFVIMLGISITYVIVKEIKTKRSPYGKIFDPYTGRQSIN